MATMNLEANINYSIYKEGCRTLRSSFFTLKAYLALRNRNYSVYDGGYTLASLFTLKFNSTIMKAFLIATNAEAR